MAKQAYLRALMLGVRMDSRLVEAALIFYHAEVPLEIAKGYMQKLERKTR